MNKKLQLFIDKLDYTIPKIRHEDIEKLVDFLYQKKINEQAINLNFICTHNSRRSHLSQIWAGVAASYFNIQNVNCYSGGTEATAMFPMIKETLMHQGFAINQLSHETNPVYAIKYDENKAAIIAFSKKYDHPFNPKSDFSAVLTCDHADKNCPIIHGADKRFSLKYEDPKAFDGTAQQFEKYQERSHQIATEMFYIFKNVNKNLS